MPDLALERRCIARLGPGARIAGVDEVGRGPWAGPVVAAAVVFHDRAPAADLIARLDDSKRLSPAIRAALVPVICAHAAVGMGAATVAEIDRLNILQASLLAMARAMAALEAALGATPDHALVDGNRAPRLACPVETVVGGDGRSASIAAASIVAKVARDRQMAELAEIHPGYGWERNAGYGTAEHRAALARLGVSPEHRRSFRPISELLTLKA